MKGWTSVRDAIRSAPGASPPRLGGRTGREECDACVGKGRNKSDREGKAFGVKSVYTPSSAGSDASGRKNGAGRFFSVSQMGANNSSLTPLNCILENWDPQGLKKTPLVFLCDTAWPRYPLGVRRSQLQNQTGTITLLKEDGIRVILSDVFLKDSGRRVLSL